VLPNADEVTFDEIVANYHTVGTTAITGEDDQSHERFPFKTPVELRESLKTVDRGRTTAIVFGREGRGLNNEELSQLDEVCSIPADDDYPVEPRAGRDRAPLRASRSTVDETQLPDTAVTRAPEPDVERFHEFFGDFLEATGQRETPPRQERAVGAPATRARAPDRTRDSLAARHVPQGQREAGTRRPPRGEVRRTRLPRE